MSFFLNKFKKLGVIEYSGELPIKIDNSLLSVVLLDLRRPKKPIAIADVLLIVLGLAALVYRASPTRVVRRSSTSGR